MEERPEAYRCESCALWTVDPDPALCGVWGRCSLPDSGDSVALVGHRTTTLETTSDHACRGWKPNAALLDTNRAMVYRYVADGSPTMVETLDAFVTEHGLTAGDILAVFGKRLTTLRAMLSGERSCPFIVLVMVCEFVGIGFEEGIARMVASLTPAQVGELEAADRRIADALKGRDSSDLPF